MLLCVAHEHKWSSPPHPEQIRVQRAAEAEREAATALPCVALGLLGAMPTPSPSHQPRPARGRSQRELPSPGTRPRVSGPRLPPALIRLGDRNALLSEPSISSSEG